MNPNVPSKFIPRPTFDRSALGRTIVNTKTADAAVVAKLFLLCQEGKISAIKEYINRNGLTVNDMVDQNGQSILHIVLRNENLTYREKLELFRFFQNINALKMSYDSQQITPLHLACKFQYTEIVKMLLQAGHNIDALDAYYKSPIFYLLAGIESECPKKSKKLIQKSKYKLESTDIYNLTKEIVLLMNQNDDVNKIISHMVNSTSILDEIFPQEIQNYLEKDNAKIVNVIKSPDSDEVKTKKIFDIVTNTKSSISSMIFKNKLNTFLKPMSIDYNTIGGWGPDNNPINKILKINNVQEFKNSITIGFDNTKNSLVTEINKTSTDMMTNLGNIYGTYIMTLDTFVDDLVFYHQTYDILIPALNGIHTRAGGNPLTPAGLNPNDYIPLAQMIMLLSYDGPDRIFISHDIDDPDAYDMATDTIISPGAAPVLMPRMRNNAPIPKNFTKPSNAMEVTRIRTHVGKFISDQLNAFAGIPASVSYNGGDY